MLLDDVVVVGVFVLFGEKYGDEVCVLMMGIEEGDRFYLVELCGGIYVCWVGDIGFFKVVSEGVVVFGVCWIEVLIGYGVCWYFDE